jgi:hypothetical protein
VSPSIGSLDARLSKGCSCRCRTYAQGRVRGRSSRHFDGALHCRKGTLPPELLPPSRGIQGWHGHKRGYPRSPPARLNLLPLRRARLRGVRGSVRGSKLHAECTRAVHDRQSAAHQEYYRGADQ